MTGSERRQTQQGKNALSVLMTASKQRESSAKKRKRSSSQFVLCPAGCGKTIGEAFINVHLDQCLPLQSSKASSLTASLSPMEGKPDECDAVAAIPACRKITQEISPEPSSPTFAAPDLNHNTGHQVDQSMQISVESRLEISDNRKLSEAGCDALVPTNPASARPNIQGSTNAFSTMMGNSKAVFSSETSRPMQQCQYLDEENRITVLDTDQLFAAKGRTPIAWTAIVLLKNRISISDASEASGRSARPVELTLATTYSNRDNDTTPVRLVKNHSRLSVPVLKSILQKSIRRRKPLPAVRVAMELADKSVGDLLRRLPIIILEDSTLHPDFPLLVWLMVAHSKDFCLSRMWLTRILKIVFEVASCPWSDNPNTLAHAATSHSCSESDDNSCLYQCLTSDMTSAKARAIVWSMLVRADYGGMKCDVQLLVRLAQVWRDRFRSNSVSSSLVTRLGSDADTLPPQWHDVPSRIHSRAQQQSTERVTSLVTHGIDRLMLEDVCVEGIDFHCSSILDHLLSLPLVGLCTDILLLDPDEVVPPEPEARRSWMEQILKHCLWHFSSGVNRRQPLVVVSDHHQSDSRGHHTPVAYEELWKQLICRDALKYQTQFVRERLAQSS